MKVVKNKNKRGAATLELLIAFSVLALNITAVVLIINSSQNLSLDAETSSEALAKSKNILEDIKIKSKSDFLTLASSEETETSGPLTYTKKVTVSEMTPCKKRAEVNVSWMLPPMRNQYVELESFLVDVAQAVALGGDCILNPPTRNWDTPQTFATDQIPGNVTAFDMLNDLVYFSHDTPPYLSITRVSGVNQGQNGGMRQFFINGFDLGGKANAIDVINFNSASGGQKKYAFLAMNSATEQLKVVDVTNPETPTLVASRSLSDCINLSSFPQGWRLFVHKDRLYFLTRETAGPEFHIFDISNPSNPGEIGSGACKGFALNGTAEDIEVRSQNVGGNSKMFVYLAMQTTSKELLVLDVTDPLQVKEIISSRQTFPGDYKGRSVFISGNKLYFGRDSDSSSGADLYVFDISDPLSGLALIGSEDIGTGVLDIRVVGNLAFLATPKSNKQLQIWDVSDPQNIFLVKEYGSGGSGASFDQRMEYESDFLYIAGQFTPNFQILYDATP